MDRVQIWHGNARKEFRMDNSAGLMNAYVDAINGIGAAAYTLTVDNQVTIVNLATADHVHIRPLAD